MADRGLRPLILDPATVREILTTINIDALAQHYPGRDGLCPRCGERLCAIRLGAVRGLRAIGVKAPVLPPHPPRRPHWDCELCDCPWPCSQARVMLGDRYEDDRRGLTAYLGNLMVDAARELPHSPADELHTRFLA